MNVAAHDDMNIPCPYDERVEFLESPIFENREGTSYIDTGIAPKAGMTYEVISQFTQEVEGRWMTVCGVFSPSFRITYYRDWNQSIESGHHYTEGFVGRPKIFTDIAHWKGTMTSDQTLTMTLFAQHEASKVRAFSQAVRIYSYKCYDTNGKLIQDLIPVRTGNDGVMFDRISRRLFLNGGSDMLVIGPNIKGGD